MAWARSEQPWAEPASCQQPVMARACELDVAEGCRAAAWFAAQAGRRPEAATLLQRACELGDHGACAELAAATTLAPGEDPEPLRRLLFAACFRGDHEPSCVRLAVALEDGLLSGHPSSEAGVVWEQACRLNPRHCGRVPPPAPPTAGTDAAAGALYADPAATADGAPDPSERRGSLSADVIRTVIRAHLAEVEACYLEALRRDVNLRGTVTVRFLIEADGHVSAATPVGDTLGDTRATQCIARVVTSWRFPAPEGGGRVSVTYPFTLETH